MAMLRIITFGGLQISKGKKAPLIAGRNTKMWELLKHLLANYPNPVTLEKLVATVCTEEDMNDPGRNIRALVYRMRKTLERHGCDPDHILSSNGSYHWNKNIACFIDFVEFRKFLDEAEAPGKSDDERIASYKAAIALYHGEFMGEKWSDTDSWAFNFVVFYRRLFLQAVESLADLYEKRLDYDNVISLYNSAILIEPYEETLFARQIQTLIKNGEYALAKRQYRQIEKFFMKEYQIAPSNDLQRLHEEAIKADIRKPAELGNIKARFDESTKHNGPILCAPDTFRHIYRFGKRADERAAIPVYLGKITLMTDGEKNFTKTEHEQAMKVTLRVLLDNLRKGDLVCRYSANQFLLMLTTKNSINIKEGLRRIDEVLAREPEWSHFYMETEIIPLSDTEG